MSWLTELCNLETFDWYVVPGDMLVVLSNLWKCSPLYLIMQGEGSWNRDMSLPISGACGYQLLKRNLFVVSILVF